MDDTLIKKLRSDAIGLQAWADGKGPYPETVRGVSKMMAQRVLKAAAEIERLNAHLTDLTRTQPAPVEQDVERVAAVISDAFEDGGGLVDGPDWDWDRREAEKVIRMCAERIVSTLTPARAEGFKAGVEACKDKLKAIGFNNVDEFFADVTMEGDHG